MLKKAPITILVTMMAVAAFYSGSQRFSAEGGSTAIAASIQGPIEANIFVNLAKKIVPSVVNISTFSTVKRQLSPWGPDDFLHRFFQDMFRRGGRGEAPGTPPGGRPGPDEEDERGSPDPRGPRAMSLGTGFIIDDSGLILTNNHVVAEADEIKISFTEAPDEKPTDGEVVGRDPELDVALIKVKTKRELAPVLLGDSDNLEVGEYVIAVGNPFGQGHSVTHGIISAKGRLAPDFPLANYLQTDAPINPGNSGGPLVNLKGEVIGINNAIEQRAQGIGFAIPITLVKKVLPQLKSKGTVSRGYIGILVNELTPELAAKMGVKQETQGPFVTHVHPGEPADQAGIKPYDVIQEFNKQPIRSGSELIAAVTAVPVGDSVPIKVSRAGEEKTFTIKIAQRPGAQTLAEKPKTKKKGKQPPRVETGMILEDLTPDTARELGLPEKASGVLVSETAYGGPADKAGLMRGDLIMEIDRKPVKSVDAFYSAVKQKKSYLLRVRRVGPQNNDAFLVIVLDLKD